jgi:hypothetical protein
LLPLLGRINNTGTTPLRFYYIVRKVSGDDTFTLGGGNGGNINIFDVLKSGKDLYKMEEFFDNYTIPQDRNYNIYCVKYELFWDNISLFNQIMEIPDVKSLYPVKHERPKQLQFLAQLTAIYNSLINKMKLMRFIEIIQPIKKEDNI